jgi:hypothetical protein
MRHPDRRGDGGVPEARETPVKSRQLSEKLAMRSPFRLVRSRLISTLISAIALLSLSPAARAANGLYGCDGRGEYFSLDLSTGAGTRVGQLMPIAQEIEYDMASGRAFAQIDGSFNGFEFDPRSGEMIGGVIADSALFTGLEYVGGVLYGAASHSICGASELRTLNPWTGVSTLVGATGLGPIAGLAYDATTATLYGITDGATGCSPNNSNLVRIDVSTGVATDVGMVGFQAASLAFGPDGLLYAGDRTGWLFRIDPATGVSTTLGPSGFGAITGLMLGVECHSAFTQVQFAGSFTTPAYDLTASPQMTNVGGCTWRCVVHLEPGTYRMKFVTDGALDTPPDYGSEFGPRFQRVPGGPFATQLISGNGTDLYMEVVNPDEYTITLNESSKTWGATAAAGVPSGEILGMVRYDAGFDFPPFPFTTVSLYRDTTLVLWNILSRYNSSFSFGGLAPGDFNLKVTANGYATAKVGPVSVADATIVVPDITLLSVPSTHSRIDVVGDFNGYSIGASPMVQALNGFWVGPPIHLIAGERLLRFVTDGVFDSPNDYGTDGSVGTIPIPGSGGTALNSGPASYIHLYASHSGLYQMQLDERNLRFEVIELPPPPPTIDVNDLSMMVSDAGQFAFNTATSSAGLEFPKGSGKTAVFAAGLWVSAGSSIAITDYGDEFVRGAMVIGVADDPTRPEYRVYTLNRSYASTTERDAMLADYNAGAVPHGAPPVGVLSGGDLDIPGDQMLWHVYNDAAASAHTSRAGSTAPLGIEVQQTTFAFNRAGPLGRAIFMKFKLVNKGPSAIADMRIGAWCDPDLGDASDDLVGCDPARSLGFCYNSTNTDAVYGSAPPAVGIDLLQGPMDFNVRRGMTSFIAYQNGTDPASSMESIRQMHGLNADGTPIIDPISNLPTTFMVSGDPVSLTGWLDTSASDRRMLMGTGPFTMAPGSEQDIVLAIILAQGASHLASIEALRSSDDVIQQLFDDGFVGPTATDASLIRADAEPGVARLAWQLSDRTRRATIYRAEGAAAWRALDSRLPDGTGRLDYEDASVRAGTRYGYRLGLPGAKGETILGETWIDVPKRAEFALHGANPNPAVGELWISFSLPSEAPAILELLDLGGRRVLALDAGSLGAGAHRVNLGHGSNVAPGVYVVRLRQGANTRSTKVAIIR